MINSYCCAEYYRRGVASIQHPLVSHTNTAEDRIGDWGKFSALLEITDSSCVLVHFDDNVDIAKEWVQKAQRYKQLGFFGIKVPKHWKEQRVVNNVTWHQNILDAIQDTCNKYKAVENQ